MSTFAKEIFPINIEDEMKQSYLDYAMSVIVGRALPDVRDGLKPVHRRVLYAMHELNNDWNKPHKKSARVVGDVIGKYHPHGDTAVYDTIVRMAQPFSLRYLLVDGQGNFGSVDGDPPAAMRYTEVRMSKMAHQLLADLDKETVDFVPNYDETEFAPTVLPTRVPNLLINGSSGIAVGMATNIPPHNLTEVVNACLALIDEPEISLDELMNLVPGPDFPTAGIINGRAGIVEAYRTGRGRIYVRAKTHIEVDEKNQKQSIIIDELPYQVNKAKLIERIAELIKEHKVEGITALRDESDKDGMRVVIEVRKNDNAEVLLNNLYTLTPMQNVFGINLVALDQGQPRLFTLKRLLQAFIAHRREVVTRRTIFDLRKARERAHILEGLAVALTNIDAMIQLIKTSASPQQAKERLLAHDWQPSGFIQHKESTYRLSEIQAQAILDLRLHRLTGLEQDKILSEYQELQALIQYLKEILESPDRLMKVIREELVEIQQEFGDKRRTEILSSQQDLETEDLIPEENVVVTLSQQGYVKYQPLDVYQAQRRGGRGKSAAQVKEEDAVDQLLVASTHDTILCFSSIGKLYWLKVYQLPQAGRASRGRPIVNLLSLAENEQINTLLPVREFDAEHYVVMATSTGTIKKTSLSEFSRPRASGIIAVDLYDDDKLVQAAITKGDDDILLFTNAGKVIRFNESQLRAMGRSARGVRGIRLAAHQRVISMVIAKEGGAILTATRNGYGKRTEVSDYPTHGRGGQGVISIQVTERNGEVVDALQVFDTDDVMLISDQGTLVRTRVDEISVIGRNTQGVRLIQLGAQEHLVGISRIEGIEGGETEAAETTDDAD
ncbi:MAG: DNA gyrase subunit A [Gammaproteobacteria bacterium]